MKNIIAFGEGRLHLRGFHRGRDRLLSGAEKKVFAADYADYADVKRAEAFSRHLATP
jgi:hypothetical protein